MVESLTLAFLTFILSLLIGGNNASITIGSIVGSGFARPTRGLALGAVGVLVGILLESYKVSSTITGFISTRTSAPVLSSILLTSVILLAFGTFLRIPMSVTHIVVGSMVGASMIGAGSLDWNMVVSAWLIWPLPFLLAWLISPLLSLTLSVLLQTLTVRIGRRTSNVFLLARLYGWLSAISAFYMSYALGANTLGLARGLIAMVPQPEHIQAILLSTGATVGVLLLGGYGTATVATNIIGLSHSTAFASQTSAAITVHLFTQLGLPVSLSHCVVGAVIGIGFAKTIVLRNEKLIREMISTWTVVPVAGSLITIILFGLIG